MADLDREAMRAAVARIQRLSDEHWWALDPSCRLMENDALLGPRPTGPGIGKASRLDDAGGRYVVFAKATFPRGLALDNVRVVVDAAHGAAYKVAPLVFSELGANVTAIGVKPNGTNINECCPKVRPDEPVKAPAPHSSTDISTDY